MYQAFNAFFDFNEAAVVGQVGHAARQTGGLRVTLGDSNPGIFAQLLQTQGYTGTLAVELQNLDCDLVANVDDFGRMLNALPRHVGDVQQAVNAAQIYECTVVGQVLDDTLNFLTFLQVGQQAFALGGVLGFDHGTTGNDNVVALLVQLDDLELEFFVFQVSGVTDRTHVNQRTRQEGTDAVQLNGETTLDLAVDDTDNGSLLFVCLLKLQPGFVALGFFAGQLGFAETIFDRVQSHVNGVAYVDFQLAQGVLELFSRNGRLGFQTGVNQYETVLDSNDGALDDGTLTGFNGIQGLFKELSKRFDHCLCHK
ncbi:hypothetical protein D3C71_555880 [compost metagenome]